MSARPNTINFTGLHSSLIIWHIYCLAKCEMKRIIAITSWQNRISPVFDTAQKLLIFELNDKSEISRREEIVGFNVPFQKINALVRSGAKTLICGAITEQIKSQIEEAGIKVLSFICGDISSVMQAYLAGRDIKSEFAMPGCKNQRRRRRRGRYMYLNY